MKRAALLTTLLFLLVPLVQAQTPTCEVAPNSPFNQTDITINANFNKPVFSTEYSLRPTDVNQDVFDGYIEERTTNNQNYTYDVTQRLPDGNYTFTITGNDTRVSRQGCVRFSVDTGAMNFWVEQPAPPKAEQSRIAVSNETHFDLTVRTPRPAQCVALQLQSDITNETDLPGYYEEQGPPVTPLQTTNGETHTVSTETLYEGFDATPPDLDEENLQPLNVICKETSDAQNNEAERYSYNTLYIGHDATPPTVDVESIPDLIVTPRESTINTATDDQAFCTYQATPELGAVQTEQVTSTNDYTQQRSETFNVYTGQNGETTLSASCTNYAGLTTQANTTVTINATADETLSIQQPYNGYHTNQDRVEVIATIIRSNYECSAELANTTTTLQNTGLQPDGRRHHVANISLPQQDGTYPLTVTCEGIETHTATSRVTRDTQNPTTPKIQSNQYTCGVDIPFTLITNQSNTHRVTYQVVNSEDPTQNISEQRTTKPGEQGVSLTPDTVLENASYRITATAYDLAENNATATATIQDSNATIPECDFEPPRIALQYQAERNDTYVAVNVSCEDNRECQPTYRYSQGNPQAICTYTETTNLNDTARISGPTHFCALVQDFNNNNATTSRVFDPQNTPGYCRDNTQNYDEVGVDCGGPNCPSCGIGQSCTDTTDCQATLSCIDGTCQQPLPHCSNGETDRDETDTDCGGSSCALCETGTTCLEDTDCLSGQCTNQTCAAPTCNDGIKNGKEVGVDCGGPSCNACEATPGDYCTTDNDCPGTSLKCDTSLNECLRTPAYCTNNQTDRDETGVDCGGPSCSSCQVDQSCNLNSDCLSNTCIDGTCTAPTCSDNQLNGEESDVDCGAVCSTQCSIGDTCVSDDDCTSRNCNTKTNTCRAASCTNNKEDGQETDVDCGGPSCSGCGLDKTCKTNQDCAQEFVCSNSTCLLSPDLDTDNDGLPDRWERKHSGSRTEMEPFQDPDGDTFTNLEEYEAGTDPNNSNSKPERVESNAASYVMMGLGFVLIATGIGLLAYEAQNASQTTPGFQPPSQPNAQQRTRSSREQQKKSAEEKEKHPKPQEPTKPSRLNKLKAQRDKILDAFNEDELRTPGLREAAKQPTHTKSAVEPPQPRKPEPTQEQKSPADEEGEYLEVRHGYKDIEELSSDQEEEDDEVFDELDNLK